MKKLGLLLCMAVIASAFVLPTAPAHASYAGAATCDVTLSVWPTTSTQSNPTPCVGVTAGAKCEVGVGFPPPSADVDCAVDGGCTVSVGPITVVCSFSASVDHYSEVCGPQGTLPPLGTADGTLTVGTENVGSYNWLRVGLTAVLVPVAPGTSAGVAAFVPHTPLPTCAAPGPLTATVVGVAAAP